MDVNTNKRPSTVSAFFSRRNAAHPGYVLLGDIAAALTVFLLTGTHLLFGAFPLGIAALAALRGWSTLAGLIGGVLAAAGMGDVGYIYAGLLLLTCGMRVLVSYPGRGRRVLPDSEGVFLELPQLRASVSAIVGFSAALYQLFVTGATTATLLFAVTMMLSTTVGTLLFAGFLDARVTLGEIIGQEDAAESLPQRTQGEVLYLQVGALALSFFLVLSLKGLAFFGLMLPYLFATAATLYVSRRFGAMHASVAGLLMMLGASPLFAPAFALLGLASGLLWELGGFYALSLGVAAGAVWGSYIGGLNGFLTVAPELILVSLVAWPLLCRLGEGGKQKEADGHGGAAESAVQRTVEQHRRTSEDRMTEMAETFSSLASVFRRVAESGLPDAEELRLACDRACDRHCESCAEREACTDESRDGAMRTILEGIGEHRSAPLPEDFRHACVNAEEIYKDCREACAALLRARGAAGVTEVLSRDYELISRLLLEAVALGREEAREDLALSDALRQMLLDRGVSDAAAAVYGRRSRWIVASGVEWQGAAAVAQELKGELEMLCGCRLTPPAFEVDGDTVTLEMRSAPRFKASTCRAYRSADAGTVSGDTVTFFDGRDDVFYALLSDGMGSGSRAAMTSGVCSVFLEKMLGAGNSKTTTLKLLNNLVRMGGEECAATVDLLELDLLSGCATFIKSGAASSYVKRGENLFRIRSKTVPLGLTETLDAEKIRFDAEPGDVIVMLSDGIVQSAEDAPWLMEILSGEWGEELSPIAERIVGVAAGTHDRRDDMSVALIRIGEVTDEAESTLPSDEPEETGMRAIARIVANELSAEPVA